MRLLIHMAAANDALVALINQGYEAVATASSDYAQRKAAGTFDDSKDVKSVVAPTPGLTLSSRRSGGFSRPRWRPTFFSIPSPPLVQCQALQLPERDEAIPGFNPRLEPHSYAEPTGIHRSAA
jgi:hypothetical protein